MSKPSINEQQKTQEPERHLGFLDIVFLSMGGQSPFLSILTYGLAAFLYAGLFGPVAIILGTLLVLINGLVVYELSKRFTKEGGYYTYAFYSLTKRLGFETGWLYVFYSLTYGVAYILGATYVIYHTLGISPWIVGLGIVGITSLFAILGIRVSTKYAIVAASLEIAIMTTLAFLFIQSTHFYFYNPFSVHINFSKLAFAILFGSSIPTGYGSITPISGEAKNARKTISRAIITVILLGGLLAAFDVYAIGDHLVYFHLISNVTKIDILNLIKDRLGIVTLIFVLFASINDGILGALAFLTATSRTIFAMSSVGFLPKFLSKFENHKGPTRAVALSSILYIILTALMLFIVNAPFLAFEILGAIAVLSSLFVHLSSNFSLVRISLKKINKRKLQISIGLIASIFSFFILIYSMEQASPIEVYVFMAWIIIGFLLAEIFSMIEEENEEED